MISGELKKELCVVYLVRSKNNIEHFKNFLESYRQNPGGIDHDLLIIFKGFHQQQNTNEYQELLTPYPHLTLFIPDEGYDITAYFSAVKSYSKQYQYFCFLNSFSIIQDREWLKKLYHNISKPEVGLVGATGSWNSNNTNARTWFSNIVREVRYKRHTRNWITTENKPQSQSLLYKITVYKKKITRFIKRSYNKILHIIYFDSFPNYHIRTNAFMLSGQLMQTINYSTLKNKYDAYRFESGKKSLTAQTISKGKRVLVVGRDGIGYEPDNWCKSKTFWISNQENLLVADNQTRDYQEGSPERRAYLSFLGWGVIVHNDRII